MCLQIEHNFTYKVVLPKKKEEKKDEEERGENSNLIKGLELTTNLQEI